MTSTSMPARPRWPRYLVACVVALAALAAAAQFSGKQETIDVVALTEKRIDTALESRAVTSNGVRLHVVLAGPADGAPVLLLHGYPEFWWAWHQQIGRLARAGFRVIAPDLRGYNGSDKPEGRDAYRIEVLLKDVLGLIEALGYRDVNLAAHDWGGRLAWHFALEHPERVRKLMVFNSPHPFAARDAQNEQATRWYRTFFQLPVVPELASRAGNWWLLERNLGKTSLAGTFSAEDMDVYRSAWDRDGSMHYMINWYRANHRMDHPVPGDGKVRVPTRVVWGMEDRFFPPSTARGSMNYCLDGSVVELPGLGHWLLHEDPERTSAELIAFFRQ